MRRLSAVLFALLALPAAAASADVSALRSPSGVVQIDARTHTPRVLMDRDGFLSAPAAGRPDAIALAWARRHATVLGLTGRDFAGLKLIQDVRAPDGVTSLVWAQTANGVPSVDTALRAAVDRRGRIVWIGGSPLHGLNRMPTAPALTAAQALDGLKGTPLTAPKRVLFNAGRLAWHVWLEVDSRHVFDVIVDAQSGRVLRKANRVESAKQVKAWDYFPGAEKGGDATPRDFGQYLSAGDRLQGKYTHTFLDTPDDDTPDPADEVHPDGDGNWLYDYTPVVSPAGNCPPAGCSWNHVLPNSWETNLDQNAQQVFYFINHFADHLKAKPIGFTHKSGNFTAAGGDPIMANTSDGAATAGVVPNPLTNALNANMLTPPDGLSPRMQMYLFEPIPGLAPDFADVNGGDDASVIYHEFTHGLTNRLVIDGAGDGALLSAQSGAMGEAWSDFYAMDFLITQGFIDDTDKPGELILGGFTDNYHNELRTEAVDCTLGASSTDCPRVGADSVPQEGGYAYDAFGKIIGSPEVHADSEIWSQTLFELRRALIAAHGEAAGSEKILQLVTGGLRLSPDEPSFLDMRNSILAADTVLGGKDHDLIWSVFAHRGMGYDASATGGNDTQPVAGFALPPKAGAATGSVSGTVTDVDTGAKLAGVPAGLAGFFSGLDADLSALTGTDGAFHITGVPAGNYGEVVVGGNGFEPAILGRATVLAGQDTGGFDAKVKRNWALLNGGAQVTQLKAKDIGCGPGLALDADPGTGISFYADTAAQDPGEKQFTVKLPAPVDVDKLVVNPSANCGDDLSASLAGYSVEFSTDGTTFKTASAGTFGASDNQANELTVPDDVKPGVRFVRMTMKNNQGLATEPTGGSTEFLDMTELSIYGTSRDKSAPKIKLGKAKVVRGPKGKVRGTVTDDNAVTLVTANGGSVKPDAKGAFAVPVTLKKGLNTVTVDAYDASQNHATAKRRVLADLRKPKLRVRRANGVVSGRATDDTGIRSVRIGKRKVKLRRGRFSVRVRGKRVKVIATDRAGRKTHKRV
jgi:extracellular elastinolytic metalloproteinase